MTHRIAYMRCLHFIQFTIGNQSFHLISSPLVAHLLRSSSIMWNIRIPIRSNTRSNTCILHSIQFNWQSGIGETLICRRNMMTQQRRKFEYKSFKNRLNPFRFDSVNCTQCEETTSNDTQNARKWINSLVRMGSRFALGKIVICQNGVNICVREKKNSILSTMQFCPSRYIQNIDTWNRNGWDARHRFYFVTYLSIFFSVQTFRFIHFVSTIAHPHNCLVI